LHLHVISLVSIKTTENYNVALSTMMFGKLTLRNSSGRQL